MLRAAKVAILLGTLVACAADPAPAPPAAAGYPPLPRSHRAKPLAPKAELPPPLDLRDSLERLNDQVRQARDKLGEFE